eukprot:jgi/Galph1/2398/GphlegSOOS_G1060.1
MSNLGFSEQQFTRRFILLLAILVSLSCLSLSLVYKYKRKSFFRKDSSELLEHNGLEATVQEHLQMFADSELKYWKGRTFNYSQVESFSKEKSHLFVVEIRNGVLYIPEYVDTEQDLKGNGNPLIAVIERILKEGSHNIRDTVLFINLLDEPRIPDKLHCEESEMWSSIKDHHGIPLTFFEIPSHLPEFPILSPTKISSCFKDILVPFPEMLDENLLKELRNSNNLQHHCEWTEPLKRIKTAMFRGSLTGKSVKEERNHRFALAKACDNEESRRLRNYLAANNSSYEDLRTEFGDGPLCDAAFNDGIGQLDENTSMVLESPSYFIPLDKWDGITYFILDIDGNSYSKRLVHLCFKDIVIIRLGIFDDFLLNFLTNGTDYIHIQPDMSDLFPVLENLRENIEYGKQLCTNKHKKCHQLVSYENMKYYVKTLLEEYSHLVHFV